MSDVIIHVENLGKRYRIGERERYLALRDVLARAAAAPFRILKHRGGTGFQPVNGHGQDGHASSGHIWALKDVSFDVRQGEVVGIIGRNGAGKTTLLKILARVAKPTAGFADVHGRMGSLLEVGTGFHPELTGRENTFLSGAILGMSKAEIRRKFDEIVAFAEVERFIDTPVKHYSSGMQMRLAFAVAAHLEPEILLIDEVLAVGDVNFQKKCLGKMGDVARTGRTILFVSHNMAAVSTLCQKGVLLEGGRTKTTGPIAPVMDQYLAKDNDSGEQVDVREHRREGGTGEVRVLAVNLLNGAGDPCRDFEYGDNLCFEMLIEPRRPAPPLHCVVAIHTTLGVPVLHLSSQDDPGWEPIVVKSRTTVRCVLPGCDLYPGTYSVHCWLGPSDSYCADFVTDVLRFHVGQGQLRRRGYDITWAHGLIHRNSSWHMDEGSDVPVIVPSAGRLDE